GCLNRRPHGPVLSVASPVMAARGRAKVATSAARAPLPGPAVPFITIVITKLRGSTSCMNEEGKLFLGGSRNPDDSFNKPEYLELKFGNRHGLITGATGTGKTVTLQIL